MTLLLVSGSPIHAQHTISNSMNATMLAMPVTPQRPIDPGVVDTTIVQIDFREEYMPDPFAPPSPPSPAVVTGANIAISFVPGVGPAIAFGIGMADALWGQQLYDYVQDTYDNW